MWVHAFWAGVTGILSGARHGWARVSRVSSAAHALPQTACVHVPRSAVQKKEEERRLKEAERLRQLREKEQVRAHRRQGAQHGTACTHALCLQAALAPARPPALLRCIVSSLKRLLNALPLNNSLPSHCSPLPLLLPGVQKKIQALQDKERERQEKLRQREERKK